MRVSIWMAGFLCLAFVAAPAAAPDDGPETAGDVVRELYDLVTFAPGTTPDWDAVRGLFIEEAVIVLRTSRETNTVFSLDGFVSDFVAFIERANAAERGFSETILKTSETVHGDIAHILVLYEAALGGSPRPPSRGLDSIQLIRREGTWRIASIVNEIVNEEFPPPEALRD